jgi:hypothetical protein
MIHVTSALSFVGIRDSEGWDRMRPEDREWYLQRGSIVHLVTELYDKGTLDESSIDERIRPYFDGYKLFHQELLPMIRSIEMPVSSERHGYCGKVDRIVYVPAMCCHLLLDIKTNKGDITARLQTAGYMATFPARSSIRKGKRGVLELKDTGKYKLEVFDNDKGDETAWFAVLDLCKWKMRHEAMPERK